MESRQCHGIEEDRLAADRQQIMDALLSGFNVPQPASPHSAAQPAWHGRIDIHYIFVCNDKLKLTDYSVVGCGIAEQTWRQVSVCSGKYLDGASLQDCS